MLDMTNNAEEKQTFITNVILNLKQNKFKIQYASGREEEKIFTIESYNETLIALEKQFLTFKKDYIIRTKKQKIKILFSQTVEAILALVGLVFTMNIDLQTEIQNLLIALLFLFSIYYQCVKTNEFDVHTYNLYTTSLFEAFIKRKEDFKIVMKDEQTNEETEWYVVNLSNIWQLENISDLSNYKQSPKKREKASKIIKKLNKTLKKKYVQIDE